MVRRATAFLLLLALAGCGSRSDPESSASPDPAQNGSITILVKNHHWLDANIYLIRGAIPDRIGTVPGVSEKTFDVKWTRLGGSTVQLAADPIGQRQGIRSEVIAVRPGAVVEWTLESNLRQSSVTVY